MKLLFITLCLLSTITANAGTPLSRSLVIGNALVTAESLQKIIKEMIVKGLQKNYSAENQLSGFTVQTKATEHHLSIPKKATLQDILSTLGIQNQIHILIDPIQTSINFGPDSLKIKTKKIGENAFSISAHWEVKKISAVSKNLKIIVPKGVFDRGFEIASKPVKIGIKPGLGAITADLTMTARLSTEGTLINLEKFETNLDDETPRLQVKLGTLTVDGKPLELEIISNGQSIITDEPTIREQIQSFEPELMKSVQKQLGKIIQENFENISVKLEKQDPFKISFNSNEILNQHSTNNANIDQLLKNISADFVFSYIQQLPKQNLFSTQVSSQVCLGTDCLLNQWGTSSISTEDTLSIGDQGAGVILYESWVQNIINSEPFQKRFREYYKNTLKSSGVFLGSDGFKIHFDPDKNAIVAVLNLKIDIKATAPDPMSSWSSFKDYSKKQLADLWENIAGSGQYVYLPVEITLKIKGIKTDSSGKKLLEIQTEIPFSVQGSISNHYKYNCNIQNMNSTIRKEVLASVKSEIGKSIPSSFKIRLDSTLDIEGVTFSVDGVLITKNKGLLISGSIK